MLTINGHPEAGTEWLTPTRRSAADWQTTGGPYALRAGQVHNHKSKMWACRDLDEVLRHAMSWAVREEDSLGQCVYAFQDSFDGPELWIWDHPDQNGRYLLITDQAQAPEILLTGVRGDRLERADVPFVGTWEELSKKLPDMMSGPTLSGQADDRHDDPTYLLRARIILDDTSAQLYEATEALQEALWSEHPEEQIEQLAKSSTWNNVSLDEEQDRHHSARLARHYYQTTQNEQSLLILTLRGTIQELSDLCAQIGRSDSPEALNGWAARTPEALSTEYSPRSAAERADEQLSTHTDNARRTADMTDHQSQITQTPQTQADQTQADQTQADQTQADQTQADQTQTAETQTAETVYFLRGRLMLDKAGMSLEEPIGVLKEALQSSDPEVEVYRLGEGGDWDWVMASLDEEDNPAHSARQAQRHYQSTETEPPVLILTLRGTLSELLSLCGQITELGATEALNTWVERTPAALSTEYSEPGDE